MSDPEDYSSGNGQGTHEYRMSLCAEIINLAKRLYALGINPRFIGPEADERQPKKHRLSRAQRLEAERHKED